jgi:hypothetical protein
VTFRDNRDGTATNRRHARARDGSYSDIIVTAHDELSVMERFWPRRDMSQKVRVTIQKQSVTRQPPLDAIMLARIAVLRLRA